MQFKYLKEAQTFGGVVNSIILAFDLPYITVSVTRFYSSKATLSELLFDEVTLHIFWLIYIAFK